MSFYNLNFNLVLIGCWSLLLIACNGEQGDDLDMFLANADKDMTRAVEPLPEVLPYIALEYNADNTLANPFKLRKAVGKAGSVQPNVDRPREPLESYPLESLLYVGSMSKHKHKYALVRTPDNSIQQVRIGNYLGPDFGLVTRINDAAVEVREMVQDDLTGDWVERNASINLQE